MGSSPGSLVRVIPTPVRRLVAVVGGTVVLAACTPAGGSAPDGREPLSVVAAFYPLQEAAQRVGRDLVQVTNLTAAGTEPHDLELTPYAVAAIQSADVVLFLGEGFQPAVQDAVAEAQGLVVDLLEGVPTVGPPQGMGQPGLSIDPHVWLDPALYIGMVEEVQRAFTEVLPARADRFQAGADAFTASLRTLDDAYRRGLAPCRWRLIVTNHAAFGYLAAAYGLRQEAISGITPEAEPSAQRLAELRDLVEREGVSTVFTEELVSPEVARTLADETGVRTAVLHTLEGLTPEEVASGQNYDSLMRANLATLEEALDCP
jgi:zinc transport system substrate-binding protein